MISVHHPETAAALGHLSAFRNEFYAFLSRRADATFDLTDAVLCAEGPVRSLVETSLAGEHRRGHGSLYAALNHGRIEIARLRRALASLPLPKRRADSWYWPWTSPAGCARRPTPHQHGSCVIPTDAARTPTSWSRAGHTRWSAR
jgi:hypothetical protein